MAYTRYSEGWTDVFRLPEEVTARMAPKLGSTKTKRTKASVQYGVAVRPDHRCGICEHWIPGGRCQVVEGPIRSDYWCRLWERKVTAE